MTLCLTKAQRRRIRQWLNAGMGHAEVALSLGVDVKTLKATLKEAGT